MAAIAIDTDQLRAIAQYCVEDAAALRATRGAVERAWNVAGLPPTVQRLRPESDAPMHTASIVANELEDEATKLRDLARKIDGIECEPWVIPPLPFAPYRPRMPRLPWWILLPPEQWLARLAGDKGRSDKDRGVDPLFAWIAGPAAGVWGAIQDGLHRIRDLAKKAEEILERLIAELTKLATGFVRTTDTMQRAVTHWLGDNVTEPLLNMPRDWDAWARTGEHRGVMGGIGRALDWLGQREHDIDTGLGKLLALDGKQNWFQDTLLNAIPIFGEARGAYRLSTAMKHGDLGTAAWEAAGLALPFLGGSALRSFGQGASAVERGVMTGIGKAAKAIPHFQDLWTHKGDILRDISRGINRGYEKVKDWAKDTWGRVTRAKRAAERIIEQGWNNLLKNFEELGKNFVNGTLDLAVRAATIVVTGMVPFLPLLQGPPRGAPRDMRVPELVRDPGSGEPKWNDLNVCMPSSGALSRLDKNYGKWHDSVVVTRTADGKYIVYLRGIDPDKGGVLHSLGNAESSRMGAIGPYELAVLKALDAAGVPRGAQVSIVAHSQGGIVAFNLAETPALRARVNVTHLLTAGSPVSADEIARAKRFNPGIQIMALDSRSDGVTKASIPELFPPSEKHTFGTWLSRPKETLGKNHDIVDGGYLTEYETSSDPDVKAFRESLDREYFTQPMEGEFVAKFK